MKQIITVALFTLLVVGAGIALVPKQTMAPDSNNQDQDPVACTADAKQCPDGSFVGRTGPNCEFEACPDSTNSTNNCDADARRCPDGSTVTCDPQTGLYGTCPPFPEPEPGYHYCQPADRGIDACIEIYMPVCGDVQVECITEPCNPVQETFPNSCFACQNERVIGYIEGKCQ